MAKKIEAEFETRKFEDVVQEKYEPPQPLSSLQPTLYENEYILQEVQGDSSVIPVCSAPQEFEYDPNAPAGSCVIDNGFFNLSSLSTDDSSREASPSPSSPLPHIVNIQTPAFLATLWSMVNNPQGQRLARWNEEGNRVIIDQEQKNELSKFFKHNKITSFIRQLNMYGFHKVGNPHQNANVIEFENDNFIRGQDALLQNISRNAKKPNKLLKRATSKAFESRMLAAESDLKNVKKQFTTMMSFFIHQVKDQGGQARGLKRCGTIDLGADPCPSPRKVLLEHKCPGRLRRRFSAPQNSTQQSHILDLAVSEIFEGTS